jgi:hypothetical protein
MWVQLLRRFDFSIACPERPARVTNAVSGIADFF